MQLEFRVLIFEEKRKPGKTSRGKILEVRLVVFDANLRETVMGRTLSLRIPAMFNLRYLLTKLTRDIHRSESEQG